MVFSGVLGWQVSPNRTIFNDKKTAYDSSQLHVYGKDTIGLFGGSTAWGWGLPKQSNMFADIIAQKKGLTIKNYSQPAYNLYKCSSQIRLLSLSGTLPKKNIIYFGINEAFCFSKEKPLFESPKDCSIKKNAGSFEIFYFSKKMTIKKWLRIFKSHASHDQPSKPKPPIDFLDQQMDFLFRLIDEIIYYCGGEKNIAFVLEPALFFKPHLSPFEARYIKNYTTYVPRTIYTYTYLYDKLLTYASQKKWIMIDTRPILHGLQEPLYWDYCHPSATLSKLLATNLNKNLSMWLSRKP